MPQSTSTIEAFPLLDFFTALQRYDQQTLRHQGLTLSEYLPILEVLAQGIGLLNESDLYSICKLLWFKPYHSEQMFQELFEHYLAGLQDTLQAHQRIAQETPEDQPTKKEDTPSVPQTSAPAVEQDKPLISTNESEEIEAEAPSGDDLEDEEDKTVTSDAAFNTVFIEYTDAEGSSHEAQVMTIGKQADEHLLPAQTKKYILEGSYFTLSARQLQQGYQLIHRDFTEGPKNQILWPETIQKIARTGFFTYPTMSAKKRRKSIGYLLLDYSNSMIAFHRLCEEMVSSLLPYQLVNNQVYYFFNHPSERLFLNSARTESIPFTEFTDQQTKHILIISDAGAARGEYSFERITKTKTWLDQLKRHRVIWFNPMPRNRWIGNSAETISHFVPMFELNEKEFSNALNQIKIASK